MAALTRSVLWILIIASVIAAGLWIIGGKRNEYSSSLLIDASPEVIFTYLTEPDRLRSWMTGLSEVSLLESNVKEDGNPKRNKTSRLMTVGGKQIRFEDEVIRFEQDKALSVQSSSNSLIMTSIFSLVSGDEPNDEADDEIGNDQTELTYRVTTRNCGAGRFLAPIRQDSVQSQIDDDIRQLKELVENDTRRVSF